MTRQHTHTLIVGAGMAGLCAARRLQEHGVSVRVVDKGRGVGGRMASRRIGRATCDHGAQFITARDPAFKKAINQWRTDGTVTEWHRTSAAGGEGHPRWRGRPTMTALPKHLARDLTVDLSCRLTAVERDNSRWLVTMADGAQLSAAFLLLTPPVPQSLALLDGGSMVLPEATREQLESIQYEPCLAVMAVLEGASDVPAPGGFSPQNGPIAWIADNQQKGVSDIPALTIHADGEYSRQQWDGDREETARDLLQTASPWLGSHVQEFQIHGWRYSKPIPLKSERCVTIDSLGLAFAGDAFGGPRVEGAALSGWAAADALLRLMPNP